MQRKSTRKAATSNLPDDNEDSINIEEGPRSIGEIKDVGFAE